jgi:hypothetical protein
MACTRQAPINMSSKLKANRHGYLVVRASGEPVTPEMVKEALDAELD